MLGKVVDADQIWNQDYIYLDWNVIKYLKESMFPVINLKER